MNTRDGITNAVADALEEAGIPVVREASAESAKLKEELGTVRTPITVAQLVARLVTMPANAPVFGTWEGIFVALGVGGVGLSNDGAVVLVVDQDDGDISESDIKGKVRTGYVRG